MDVFAWLLDSDPALRWQVQRDLLGAPDDVVARDRAAVAVQGWGARLLAAQAEDGRWDGGTYRPGWAQDDRPFFDAWTATHFSLQQLVDFGVDPDSAAARAAIDRVAGGVRWEHAGQRYFDGEVEPCINGVVLQVAAYFGHPSSTLITTVLDSALPDGGWNCWAPYGARVSSFHSTICVVEGLLAWEQAGYGSPEVARARAAGEEYLLERGLVHRRSTGALADPRLGMLSYPVRWYHDVLRGLEHFRRADRVDPRLSDSIDLLRAKATPDGRWCLENVHEGPTLFDFDEREGAPSRWVTLRALRVLRWWEGSGPGSA